MEMGSSTVSSSVVVSACEANVMYSLDSRDAFCPRFGPRSASTRVDGRERLSDAAPTTALAASARGDALSPQCQFRALQSVKRVGRREFSRVPITTSGRCDPRVLWAVVTSSEIGLRRGAHDKNRLAE